MGPLPCDICGKETTDPFNHRCVDNPLPPLATSESPRRDIIITAANPPILTPRPVMVKACEIAEYCRPANGIQVGRESAPDADPRFGALDPGPFSVVPSERRAMWAVVSEGNITVCDSYSKTRMEQIAELLNKHYAEKKEAGRNAD